MTQAEALAILKTGAHVFLTGEPGAGKTHTINRYVEYLRAHGVEPAITASTGIAATHIGGMTIHSWSGIGIRPSLSEYDLEEIATKERLVKRIQATRVLVIDEVSMLSGDTLTMVDQVCRAIKRASLPFGGLQVILVGDFFQLPPIMKRQFDDVSQDLFSDDETPRSHFAFGSRSWAALNPLVCYLSEQHRQEDPAFLSILSALRSGSISEAHKRELAGRNIPKEDHANLSVTKLFTHNVDVDRINADELAKLPGNIRSFAMEGRGPEGLLEHLKRGCLSPEVLGLRIGAKVMFTKNDFEGKFVNGTLGTVIDFRKEDGAPIVETFSGERITAAPMEWSINDNGKILARITQVPLRLAWAITVHKSQGMSLDAAFMDLSSAFEYGQGYVALSRVRALSGLFLGGMNDRALMVHPEVKRRDEQFRSHSQGTQEAFADMDSEELEKFHKDFLTAIGGKEKAQVVKKTKKGAVAKVDANGETYDERLARLREKHPNAYRPWSEEDDRRISALFEEGTSEKELATIFQRKPGAINARLKKLGLIIE